ncbi:putative aldouronate transport system permease protein [Pullulanibacillus pueri]|uniref:Protein LplB n=1 Tax=Pullulanibacillus pueri TaxID=1437324 RepID=A0A8J3ELF3_9BACL|nr:ABC transporter permease subunit [Pullulanibacillus pueri]MBM7681794.1 putative aldouronate transport system permease protein [Pullulanibacillus pueri]GGH76112.1 protein LplB [Pullulanibacillus pueri]
MEPTTKQSLSVPVKPKSSIWKDIVRDKYLYLLLLPGMILLIIFKYIPMYGVIIAFKDYNILLGITKSAWVGFEQFEKLFRTPDFLQVLWNTLLISLYKLVAGFTLPIILSLLLNEVRKIGFKRVTQSIIYLPHFISWVVFAGIITTFLNPVDGLVNYILQLFGHEAIDFLGNSHYFRSVLVSTEVYKTVGWGTIIYLAAISGVNPELYEAAIMDGANKFRQMWHVTLPAIRPVIIILVILSLGSILEAGFQQIYLLYSPLVYDVGDVIDTYVYREGILNANYSFATAAGLFKSMIALILIVTANRIAKRFGQSGLW